MKSDFIIIGAGIFGVELALKLASENYKVTLIERGNQILSQASKMNQNRVHLGFHYPRSLSTALQAIEAYDYFIDRFKNCIRPSIESFYMVSNEKTRLISLNEYVDFCEKLNINYKTLDKSIFDRYLNTDKIEDDVFLVNETVFEVDEIRKQLIAELKKSSVNVIMNECVTSIEILFNNHKRTNTTRNNYYSDFIINCTYEEINNILENINCKIDLKFQNVLLPIISSESYIPGMTIMDGPYCSILPKGLSSNQYILSDVKNSIIHENQSIKELPELEVINKIAKTTDIIESMNRYIKFPDDIKVIDYWLTRKALAPQKDDRRLTQVFSHNDFGVFSVLQGKISTSQLVYNELIKLINKNKI